MHSHNLTKVSFMMSETLWSHSETSGSNFPYGRFVVCDPSRRLATLVRMLRQDLEEGKQEGSRTRVIVFAERSVLQFTCICAMLVQVHIAFTFIWPPPTSCCTFML